MHWRTMLHSYRFLSGFALAGAILISCQQPRVPKVAATPVSQSTGALANEFNALLRKGDYAGAIALVDQSALAATEKDGVTGTMILDGLVDPSASTRPAFPLSEGLARMERAALGGRAQSIADLRGKFTTGVNDRGKTVVMPANAVLAECWSKVEAGGEKAGECVALRRRLGFP